MDDHSKLDDESIVSQLLHYSGRRWISVRWAGGDGPIYAGYTKFVVFEDEDEDEDDVTRAARKYQADHPWVVDVSLRKSNSHLTIMMRLCTQGCYAGSFKASRREFDPWPVWRLGAVGRCVSIIGMSGLNIRPRRYNH